MSGEVLFQFKGEAYNRPCGRGVCIGPDLEYLEEKIPEGEFEIEIICRKKPTNDLASETLNPGDTVIVKNVLDFQDGPHVAHSVTWEAQPANKAI